MVTISAGYTPHVLHVYSTYRERRERWHAMHHRGNFTRHEQHARAAARRERHERHERRERQHERHVRQHERQHERQHVISWAISTGHARAESKVICHIRRGTSVASANLAYYRGVRRAKLGSVRQYLIASDHWGCSATRRARRSRVHVDASVVGTVDSPASHTPA